MSEERLNLQYNRSDGRSVSPLDAGWHRSTAGAGGGGECHGASSHDRMVFRRPSQPFRPLLRCVVDLDVGWTASFQVNTSGHEAVIRCHTKGRFEIVQSGQICGLRHSVDPW